MYTQNPDRATRCEIMYFSFRYYSTLSTDKSDVLSQNRKTAIKIAQNRKAAERNNQTTCSKFTKPKPLTLDTTAKYSYTRTSI